MPWKKKSFFTLNLASVLMLLGCGLMSTLPESGETTKAQYGYGFLMGLGIGISISTMVLVTSLKVLFIDHGKFFSDAPLAMAMMAILLACQEITNSNNSCRTRHHSSTPYFWRLRRSRSLYAASQQ
jgi:hypothetical protein